MREEKKEKIRRRLNEEVSVNNQNLQHNQDKLQNGTKAMSFEEREGDKRKEREGVKREEKELEDGKSVFGRTNRER